MRRRQRPLPPLPVMWLMTDERVRDERLLRAVARLPRGSGIVLRHYRLGETERHALFAALRRSARRRGLMLLLAGPVAEALAWGADGAHGRGDARDSAPPTFLRSAPVHHIAELRAATRAGADMIFLSPLFATRSHPGQGGLGAGRFAAIARLAPMPVMALGGVGPRHRRLVRMLGAAGFGAIDSLVQ